MEAKTRVRQKEVEKWSRRLESKRFLWRVLLLWAVLSAVPVAFLEGLRLVVEAPFSWDGLVARWAFVVALLFAARWTRPCFTGGGLWVWPWSGIWVAGVGGGATLVYAVTQATWAAWAVLGALYVLLLGLDTVLGGRRSLLWPWGVRGLLALAGGLIPVAISQIESHFATRNSSSRCKRWRWPSFGLCCWR